MPARAKSVNTARPRPESPARQLANPRGKTAERGYGGAWQRFRESWLAEHPLCRSCEDRGLIVAATDVDHVIPHRGDPVRFWLGPFQSLCGSCHGRKSAGEARGGNEHAAGRAGGVGSTVR